METIRMTNSYKSSKANIETISTRAETILERLLESSRRKIKFVGSASNLSLAFALAQSSSKQINSLPHVVVVASSADANKMQGHIEAFDPQRPVHLLPHSDVSPYSGLYSKTQITSERVRFLHFAQNAKPGEVFVVPIGSLLQRTLPFSLLKKNSFKFRKNDLLPDEFSTILSQLGYQAAPIVEDIGQFSVRGGIVDVYSPAHESPVRIELFGDLIESMRLFSAADQRSITEISQFDLIPAKEVLYEDDNLDDLVKSFRESVGSRPVDKQELEEAIRSLSRHQYFPGIEFLISHFYTEFSQVLSHFNSEFNLWYLDPNAITKHADEIFAEMKSSYGSSESHVIRPQLNSFFCSLEELELESARHIIEWESIDLEEHKANDTEKIEYKTFSTLDFSSLSSAGNLSIDVWAQTAKAKLQQWREAGYSVIVSYRNQSHKDRLNIMFEKMGLRLSFLEPDDYRWQTVIDSQAANATLFHASPRVLFESVRIQEEKLIFLRDEDFFGKKLRSRSDGRSSAEEFSKQAQRLSFGDLKPGDQVVHTLHGIGLYEGLKVMAVGGADSEFIQIAYKDKDKLYLPVYRIGQLQKYTGGTSALDKLGGIGWEKTKTKVRAHLKDVASELLALYAKRSEMKRPGFRMNESEFGAFENSFPYDETDDQHRAIMQIARDMTSDKPMDRLVCGDVGFGKTEVAMRAAFLAVENQKQVVVLAPTTVLSFQHLETFKKRFAGWPVVIKALNRFVTPADVKTTVSETKTGKVDILIGTHRVLSKDIEFANLGLMIIDEEQKFGVIHKERIKKMKSSVDSLTLSATPIPRTLNMSLVGIRDLSLINTAPVDRLPTRTFICRFDGETIQKAVRSEIERGGQVYFIHNRVQSIYGVADQLRELMPEVRMKVAHGQMDEDSLESAMISFFNHEIDVLICTAIVESGMDNPRANTMFIDNAQIFGLSQLYQLRGRVGRSKERAYCYLIVPNMKALEKDAQERLKVIQENTALGSGIRIAQYDLELRGAGDILGEEQSGNINAVGYELYMDLLNEAIHSARGEDYDPIELDPEINLRIPSMIPDSYIADIRTRLSFYKALSDISNEAELERIEEELRDQYGPLPEPTINLLGLMLIRAKCKELGVRDLSSGLKSVSLIFTEKTKIKPETAIQLAMRENKKYSLTPDSRLNIRMNNISWSAVVEELNYLLKL
jgi:transcription-repair coupling factor (superfamily II helicase)